MSTRIQRIRQRLRRYVRIETEHPTMSWAELQAQLAEAREAVERWKHDHARVADERSAHKGASEAQRRTADERLLRIVSPAALRQMLPHRLAMAPRLAGDAAAARLARFEQVSPAYRDVRRRPGDPRSAIRGTLDGIAWWMPALGPAASPKSPLHAISQTRDVALGGITIEIGAGTGQSSIARVALGDAVAAYCTEPDEVAYACLVANVAACGLEGLVLPDRVSMTGAGSPAPSPGKVEGLDRWVHDVGIDMSLVGFVQINGPITPALLEGARDLLGRPHIVWQVEILAEALGDRLPALLDRLTASFTHCIVISTPPPGKRVRPVSDLDAVVTAAGDENVALLLYSEAS